MAGTRAPDLRRHDCLCGNHGIQAPARAGEAHGLRLHEVTVRIVVSALASPRVQAL